MNYQDKLDLITDGLQEILGREKLEELLKERDLKLYWGTATTGKPHIGYLKPLLKIAQFLKAGCEVTILFADLHAYLDSLKSSLEELEFRTQYYEILIKEVLVELGVDIENSKIKFVRGTSFQLSREYNLDMYKLMSTMSLRDATKAGTEVVKQSKNPKMASLLYPGLQALDEEYLKVDAQFGGVDQRKIFTMALQHLPKIGYKGRVHLMNPIIPSFTSGTPLAEKELNSSELTNVETKPKEIVKMSSSEQDGKIDLLDTPKQIRKKIGKGFCERGNIDCGILSFVKHVLFPINKLKTGSQLFKIERPEKYGGNIEFETYDNLESAFEDQVLDPVDLKQGVSNWIIQLLENTRNKLKSSEEFQKILKNAYKSR
jgi:tyrosyl-tRNA synthetase